MGVMDCGVGGVVVGFSEFLDQLDIDWCVEGGFGIRIGW